MNDSKSEAVKAIEEAIEEMEEEPGVVFENVVITEIDCSKPYERKLPLLDQRLIQVTMKKEKNHEV